MTTPVPIERIDFILTAQQLNTITLNGQRDATNGRVFGDRLYDNNETGLLDNATVKILNDLTANLIANPIDVATIDRMITDQEPDTELMERFGDILFYLVEAQIYEQHNKNGIPANAYSVGYPLRDALEKLEQHKIRDFVGNKIDNGLFVEGPLAHDDLPVWDFMFDDDSDVIDCFWYIVKMISLVI